MSATLVTTSKWILKIIPAAILCMNAFFKLTSNPAAIQLFTNLGMEVWGRFSIGVLEALTAILILYPRTSVFGGLLGTGLMAAALYFHFTLLGIRMNGSMALFNMAIIVLLCCLGLVFIDRKKLSYIGIKMA